MTNMQLGIVGLSTMGGNLARNAARNGARTVVFNRTTEKMEQFVAEHGAEGEFVPAKTLKEFVAALTPPRPVLLMVKAGQPVDDVMEELLPLLSPGDILIDAGNSHYHDTERRTKRAEEARVHFVGMGVSGGEEGALKGPSMMPGGDKEAIDVLMPLFAKMAAHDGSTEPALSGAEGLTTGGDAGSCIAYMGPGGAGHFVKMVHNGIEYGIMQLIAEAYHLLKVEGGLSNPQLAEVFGQWNSKGFLQSFLIEITERVFRMKDAETSGDLIDVILDSAGQKGTGKWTTEAAFHYGVAVPTITAAVDARIMSSGKAFRTQEAARWQLAKRDVPLPTDFAEQVRTALELSVINAYAQGFQLLSVAGQTEGWNLSISEIARIWRGGCIIRSALLPVYQKVFAGDREAAQLIRDCFDANAQLAWRSVVARGAERAIPLPAMSASLSYFDAYRTDRLPQNLIQAQRDLFGAHTYERTDKAGIFHSNWNI